MDRLTRKRVHLPDQAIYQRDDGFLMPAPKWRTIVSLLHSRDNYIPKEELNSVKLSFVLEKNRGYGLKELKENMTKRLPSVVQDLRSPPMQVRNGDRIGKDEGVVQGNEEEISEIPVDYKNKKK